MGADNLLTRGNTQGPSELYNLRVTTLITTPA